MTQRITIRTDADAIAYLDSFGMLPAEARRTERGGLVFVKTDHVCHRCGGAGYYPTREHGACFECGGLRPRWTEITPLLAIAKSHRRRDLARARRDSKRTAQATRVAAEAATFLAGLGDDEREALTTEVEYTDSRATGILCELQWKLRQYGSLSDAQVELAVRVHAEHRDSARIAAERDAAKGEVVEGRYPIDGTVLTVKVQEGPYGAQVKMLIEVAQDNGLVKLWGTVPAAIEPAVQKGATVQLTATVERSQDDADFGFYRRPSKAVVVSGGRPVKPCGCREWEVCDDCREQVA